MNQLTALYFPETTIRTSQAAQELLFFDQISYYLPAEDNQPDETEPEDGLCRGYAPVPFTDDLDRFRQLIRELKGNEAEFYSGQLSSMTLRYLEDRDESTVKNLISTISGQGNADKADETKKREELWQARLLLQLAAMLAGEEQDLQNELSALSAKKVQLFDDLKGEEEMSFAHGQIIAPQNFSPVRPEILCRAWAKLFVADKRQQEHWILNCGLPETADILFEINESLSNQRPTRLFRIPLPNIHGMEKDDFLAGRTAFRNEARDVLQGFKEQLNDAAINGLQGQTLKNCTDLAAQWTRLFDASGPWGQDILPHGQLKTDQGAPHLEVYLCNRSLPDLLTHCSRSKVRTPLDQKPHFALVAVKSTKPSTCKG